jgi:hypothetical protein
MLLTYYNDCNIFLPAVFANKVTLKVKTKGITTRLDKKCWERNIHKKNRSRILLPAILRREGSHIKCEL